MTEECKHEIAICKKCKGEYNVLIAMKRAREQEEQKHIKKIDRLTQELVEMENDHKRKLLDELDDVIKYTQEIKESFCDCKKGVFCNFCMPIYKIGKMIDQKFLELEK